MPVEEQQFTEDSMCTICNELYNRESRPGMKCVKHKDKEGPLKRIEMLFVKETSKNKTKQI